VPQVAILQYFFAPTQGLFNFLIYIRPRYGTVRREFPDLPWWWSLYCSIWHPLQVPPQPVASRADGDPLASEPTPGDSSKALVHECSTCVGFGGAALEVMLAGGIVDVSNTTNANTADGRLASA
jgi:hypothetical protein